ncbi:MAG: 3-dehydroquinate synthase [Streptosporangiales bacterium]|nr:3-dehydroquinate synthase [Streptosporangiales bacterium]
MGTTRIRVEGEQPYEVLVGEQILDELPAIVGDRARQVAVVTAPPLQLVADQVAEVLDGAGYDVCRISVPDAEAGKDVSVAAMCWNRLGERNFTRTDCVVAVGGGAVTDLAGFVAASWLRGVRVVHVPTSLLGMVDAAVGGKTGINTSAGKNLVGAFHPPAGVLCDLSTLATLPREDYVAGLAEVVKAGFIADPKILDLIEGDPTAATTPSGPVARQLVERAIAMKADVVAGDLREQGPREALNYGHTLGHAVERLERYKCKHGYAVSVGMVFAAELARRAGELDEVTAKRHVAVLEALGLPTHYHAKAWPKLLESMRVDKKARGAKLRFVVLAGLADPIILEDPDPELLEQTYSTVGR